MINTFAWVLAWLASLVMAYLAFVEYTPALLWDPAGWLFIGLSMFCLVATVGALMDDIAQHRSRKEEED